MILPNHVHFVGVGGIGMSGLAKVLLERGHTVSGSDRQASSLIGRLSSAGATISVGHRANQVQGAELIVVSSAVPTDNPEIAAAQEAGIPIIKRAELLGLLMQEQRGIAVAGTHGKTTTSAMLALILLGAGLDPTILVGGEIRGIETNARRGAGDWLVCEADEYDSSFLRLQPDIALITNVEADHLDHYGSLDAIHNAFRTFADQVTGELVLCADDPFLAGLADTREHPVLTTYGLNAGDWRAEWIKPNARGGMDFTIIADGRAVHQVNMLVPGHHNVSNALGAIATAYAAGVPIGVSASVLNTFGGVHRRQEIRGEADGITVVDDYGHHPTEIRVTLDALRGRFPGRRVVCLFQPHTYSRTKHLLAEFGTCFSDADAVVLTDIYAARERDEWGVSVDDLVASVTQHHHNVRHLGTIEDAAEQLALDLVPGDVLVTMGAGDVYRAGDLVLAARSTQ